ncbi:MAG TPA: spermidine synthase [Thermoanaerobaculia bacterium]|nr:spermidine synthase [Thermoanaerobaculia bacterium]
MIPWELIDTTTIPGETELMRLFRRGEEYSIRIGHHELMNNREHGSEDALAELVCKRLRGHVRVLVGGLGMGYTLAAVLRDVDRRSEVVVAELVPAVVRWHRGPLAGVSNGALDDPRVTIREADVAHVIAERREAFDAILLDVDNGPAGLTAKTNDRLYGLNGLRSAYAALRPKGILAVWAADPDPRFTKRLQQVGFTAEEIRVRGHGRKGQRYLIWLATRG